MARTKRRNSTANSKQPRERMTASRDTGEEKFADALTIIWMLAAVATLAAQTVAGLARAIVLFTGEQETPRVIAQVLPWWFLLCSLATGVVCLILTPLAYVVRRSKPPMSIMVAAVMIGTLPLIVLAAILIMR